LVIKSREKGPWQTQIVIDFIVKSKREVSLAKLLQVQKRSVFGKIVLLLQVQKRSVFGNIRVLKVQREVSLAKQVYKQKWLYFQGSPYSSNKRNSLIA
jgi:hypothetical protein